MMRRKAPRLLKSRGGFTLIELVVVITIAGILMMYAIPKYNITMQRRQARNARDVFAWTAARARARAIQLGTVVLFEVNPTTNRAWIVKRNATLASDTLVTVNFQTEYDKVTLSTPTNTKLTLCFNPRGYTITGTNCTASNTPAGNTEVTFTRGRYTSVARVRPLGQVDRL
jgi:prepilin-type N-terminal cleavage/methylation domain-containing protein